MVASILHADQFGTTDTNMLRVCGRSQWGDRSSGYRNVYFARLNRDGVPVWVAKVKRGGRLRVLRGSRSTEPRRCAEHVLRWYRSEYGERWREAMGGRKVNPFVTKPVGDGRWRAAVWVLGRREEVVVLRRMFTKMGRARWERVPEHLEYFWSRAAARAGVRRYLERMYGLFAAFVVWRGPVAARTLAA